MIEIIETMLGFIRQFAVNYNQMTSQYPLIVNCCTGFLIAAIGDVCCQKFLEKKKVCVSIESQVVDSPWQWDYRRSAELGVIRACVITPFITFWYPFVVRASPGMTLASVLGRVVVDQSVGSPVVITMVFVGKSLIRGDLSTCWDRMKDQFGKTWLTGFKYWPIVHLFTFSVVPPIHRPLFAHIASVYWMAQLSYFSSLEVLSSESRRE